MDLRVRMLAASVALAAGLAVTPTLAGSAPLSSTVDLAQRQGAAATLSPQVSWLLGLSAQRLATPVRQLRAHSGHVLRTFNVGASHRHEIVICTFDEDKRVETSYLLTVAGKLRKVVIASGDGEPASIPRAHALVPFTNERDFWAHFADSPKLPP